MSKIVLYPANDYDFDAADVAAYLAGLTSGVFSSAEDFPVTAAGGLKVTVGAGRGWVHPSRFTGYSITKRESDTLTMPLADPSLPRIDRIVMRYDAGARAASLQVLQGTASSTPTAPAISRTELIYDLCLAEIARPAGSTSISTGQITDTRLDEALCGIVRDSVTGIPTDELLAAARERIGELEEKATTSAAAAKDSAEAAKSSETKSAASEKRAKTSETAAKQALQDTETEHTTALQDIAQARTTALNDVAASTKTATTAANTATQQATAAAGSASTAATKAGEASTSAGAAFNSRQAAEKAQKAAENAAELAGARASTDKTLSIENAPADAAATGAALDKKANKDIVLGPDGNAIFYSKAEVEAKIKEILAAQREEDLARIKFWASDDPTSPASFIGGTWERIEGKFIMGASDTYPAGSTGGSATHTQTQSELATHVHFTKVAHVNDGGYTVPSDEWRLTYKDPGNSTAFLMISTSAGLSTGESKPMDILNPYYSMYIWHRVA